MKLLVACEYSGTVRDAFAARGYDATSCDILPSDTPGKHYQGDVFDILDDGWDMLIGFPPCTYLSCLGLQFCDERLYGKAAIERKKKRVGAMEFVKKLYYCDIPYVALENPLGHLNTHWRKPDQIIHPYYFGNMERKQTCLWLKNLPILAHTHDFRNAPKPDKIIRTHKGRKREGVYYTLRTNTAKERARFWPGIAAAMADQWGPVVEGKTKRWW